VETKLTVRKDEDESGEEEEGEEEEEETKHKNHKRNNNNNKKRTRNEDSDEEEEEQDNALCGSCGTKGTNDEFWICCDLCERWFHGRCVKVTPAKAEHIKQYKCPDCTSGKRKSSH
jgi:PHD-finger